MTKIGSDIRFFGRETMWGTGPDILHVLHSQGLEGVNIRTLAELSPTLDKGELNEFRATAEELGMYIEMGIGKINPYMTSELPSVRALGDGDYVAGMIRMIEASAEMGWHTLWTACGGVKAFPVPFDTDRARPDAPWPDQLAAIRNLVAKLVPALRANGSVLAIETHEEITTFELVRLVESINDPSVGICLDPANPLARGESPDEAVSRVAPFVVSTQLRDVVVLPFPNGEDTGVTRFLRPCGDGQLRWVPLLDAVLTARPEVNLTIEGIGGAPGRMDIPFSDPAWLAHHPDFTSDSPKDLQNLAAASQKRVNDQDLPSFAQLDVIDPDHRGAHDRFVGRSASFLRSLLSQRGDSFTSTSISSMN